MDHGPPCRRCTERNLSCVLNKSLQTLIEERSQWKSTVAGDLEHLHAALQDVLGRLSFPSLPPLLTSTSGDIAPSLLGDAVENYDVGPSCDNSPRISPRDDALHVPIESLYQITRLRALRAGDNTEQSRSQPRQSCSESSNDLISRGLIGLEDAERLVQIYLRKVDHFIYKIAGSNYDSLEAFRRKSPILTVAICAVAALHDPSSSHLYTTCSRELQRLISASMFARNIDQGHMLAMCVASYWLHDISWTLSGYAIRRATEINLGGSFHRLLAESKEEAMECLRMWYTLYICDNHLSILYGRAPVIREDASIVGWKQLVDLPVFSASDKRIVSQIALLSIMNNFRELFGSDPTDPIPRAFGSQLASFSRQVDQWMATWTVELSELAHSIGQFPAKGVVLHHHLAKLHIHSCVFRGYKEGQVPSHFEDHAIMAVAAATSVVEMLLNDPDIRDGLVGVPHYIHSMIAFACVFLLKVSIQHSGQYTDDQLVNDLTMKAAQQFRSTAVGKHHLVHLMAEGLEKMVISRTATTSFPAASAESGGGQAGISISDQHNSLPMMTNPGSAFNVNAMGSAFGDDFGFLSTTPFLQFDTNVYDYNQARFSI
ncbi:hypothetical protein IQ06DRAFT_217835 [Phaeosphaeriaceae sp. SRC1lsM3a]|nr:hypothetical protein IQ06DRAFT_217835 [Stagonospora sp. SRC1lsM3a]